MNTKERAELIKKTLTVLSNNSTNSDKQKIYGKPFFTAQQIAIGIECYFPEEAKQWFPTIVNGSNSLTQRVAACIIKSISRNSRHFHFIEPFALDNFCLNIAFNRKPNSEIKYVTNNIVPIKIFRLKD